MLVSSFLFSSSVSLIVPRCTDALLPCHECMGDCLLPVRQIWTLGSSVGWWRITHWQLPDVASKMLLRIQREASS
jgi:hypothetical protein